jgi:Tfp pilus assembly protein PilV
MKRTVPRRRGADSSGFTLISVLVAMFIFWIGMIAVARTMVGVTSAATQGENISSIATISNAFWGVVQSEPSMLQMASFQPHTFDSTSISSAPAALRPWLTSTVAALPNAQAQIVTYADAASNAACTSTTGCTVVLTLSWQQLGSPGQATATRSQTFYYQFGL